MLGMEVPEEDMEVQEETVKARYSPIAPFLCVDSSKVRNKEVIHLASFLPHLHTFFLHLHTIFLHLHIFFYEKSNLPLIKLKIKYKSMHPPSFQIL